MEWRVWTSQAAGYHVTNVLLHAASAVLVWRILLGLGVPGAWLAAMIFAVHPVNVESVAWITQRKNTLTMFFYALSLWLYLRFEKGASGGFYVLSLCAFLLALLSKTSVVMLPFVLLGCAWWLRGHLAGRDLARTLPFFGLALVLGLVTVWFQEHRAIAGETVQSSGFWGRLAGAGWAVWFYLGKALLPWRLSFVYPRWEIDTRSLLSYAPLVALMITAAICWRCRRSWGRAALFALGYFVLMLAPILGFLDIYFQRYSLVADHWQYFAIIGPIALAAGMASLLAPAGFNDWKLRVPAAAVVALLGLLTWRQASLYADPIVLWEDTLGKNPGCWMAHNNLGLLLAQRAETTGQSNLESAMEHYRMSLRLKSDQVEAHINLGSALMKLGRLEDARGQFGAAIKANPANGMAYYNLGLVLEEEGKSADAQKQYRQAIAVRPDYAEPHNNLGAGLQAQGNMAGAQAEFEQALRLEPDYARARNNLGLALAAQGRTTEAIGEFRRALQIEPASPEAHNNLGKSLAEQGKLVNAKDEFSQALRLKPGYADALLNLGNTFMLLGQLADAASSFDAALHANPNFAEAHVALAVLCGVVGRTNVAVAHFSEALRLKPDYAEAAYQWGAFDLNRGRADDAASHFAVALQSRPEYGEAHYQLAVILAERRHIAEAIAHYRAAVRLKPDWVEGLNNLAWILATQRDEKNRDGREAIRLAGRAVELTANKNPGALDTLAAAYAEAGRFPEATNAAQKAIAAAKQQGQDRMAAEIQKRLELYQGRRGFREP
jgi:tetratricopeptide (TPR) repeat protein